MNTLADTLHTLLKNNIVVFTFRKKDGTIRIAKGTRNLSLASACGCDVPTPKGEEQPNSYYDIEKDGWRSYIPANVLSIDGVLARTDTEFAKKPTLMNEPPKVTKKGELPKREIPVSKPTMVGGADIDNLGGLLGGLLGGFGGGIPKEEIRKSMDKLDKDIVVGAPAHSPKIGTPVSGGKVGTPIFEREGIALPIEGEGISIDDFAKLIAKYVVSELIARLTN